MATTPQHAPITNPDHAERGKAPMTGREKREQQRKEQQEADKRADDVAYDRATGKMDDETREKLLALGADVTRASPATEQPLPDAVPGLTTTTGAARSPIDPTTAAVPADPEDERTRRMPRGFPTMGSGREGGKPEQLFKERENADDVKKPLPHNGGGNKSPEAPHPNATTPPKK